MKKFIIIPLIIIVLATASFAIFLSIDKRKRPSVKIPILLYHDFANPLPDNDPDNFEYINTPESLEENIKVLLDNGYTFISFEELNESYKGKTKLPKKPILLTFDDGYYSNYKYAYPILKKYNVKSSIFIITDNIGKTVDGKKYLSWNNCKTMQDSGLIEIHSHSKRHVFYDRFPVRTLKDDVKESFEKIEKHLGKKDLKVFAYPYGAHTKESVFVLKINGIDMQVYDVGMNNFKDFNKNYIKRINVPCEMTGIEIIQEINNTN